MRRIIYAWNYLGWGGAQMYTLSLIRTVREEFQVTIVLPKGSNETLLGFIRSEGVDVEFFEPPFDAHPARGILEKFKVHRAKWKSEKGLLEKLESMGLRDSIIHVELAPWQSQKSLSKLCGRARAVFVTMHNAVDPGSGWRSSLWKRRLGALSEYANFHAFTANREAKECFRGYFSDSKYEDIAVTYACIDSEEAETVVSKAPDRELLRRFGIPDDAFVVMCIGQFIDRKGRWEFLDAARRVIGEHPDCFFVWIANSAPPEEDLERARSFGLGESFLFLTSDEAGESHLELMQVLRQADVFALPSRLEGLPISLLEAMALGVPCVTTAVNAIPEAIEDKVNGLLVEPGDPVSLAEAVVTLKTNPELASRIAEKARKTVLDRFTDKAVGAVALAKYREAFGE